MNTEQENAVSEEQQNLNVNDLNSLRMIIDLASSRGAFKPGEMTAVGQTYNRLVGFLEAVAKQQELAKKQEEQPAEVTD